MTVPGWLAIPGVRHSIGLARWWHFSIVMLWTINGIAFYVLIFATGQWLRLIPVTWGVFPAALSTALQYASGALICVIEKITIITSRKPARFNV